jgi:hypothetical protein
MTRLAVLGFAVVLPVSGGCASDGEWNPRRLFTEPGAFKKAIGWEEVKTPRAQNLPRGQLEVAERVETLGHKIIAQNALTGIEPLFYTIGVPESVLFHRGAEELFISDGLVKQCKTEAELAAVLCTELGQMVAEKRAVRRVGAERDAIADNSLPGGASVSGGNQYDPIRAAELGYRDKQPKLAPPVAPADVAKLSADLMKGSGYDPAVLEQIQPLLKQSDRGAALRKQMSRPASAPLWEQ